MARWCSAASPTEPTGACLTREVPLSAAGLRQLAHSQPQHYPVLLESAATGPLGRYSILAAYPQQTLWLDSQQHVHGLPGESDASFLQALEGCWADNARLGAQPVGGLPFRGGWMVYLGYELAREIEPQLVLPAADAAVGAFALRVPTAFIFDHLEQCCHAIAEAGHLEVLDQMLADAAAVREVSLIDTQTLSIARLEEEAPHFFQTRVERALDYIRAGDVYQANLSRPWRIELTAEAQGLLLYERLRAANPAPFAAYAHFQGLTLLSSSPERLVRVHAGVVETRPIAGTRARSGVPGGDDAECAALVANPKERAEHVMLIDLERNDLGRICQAGTVRTDEFMLTETYAHVHHIVSNVRGELRPGVTPIQVLRAVFPGGTITGCPKYRCMQIIGELERQPRNAYTGALGYINHDGSMDFNILIRTLTLQGKIIEFRAGAGIVADSDWMRELHETRAKARGMLAALGVSA